MWSLAQIIALNEEIARIAEAKNLVPAVPSKDSLEMMKPFLFPNLGYYEPKGWEKIDTFFVDKSGRGYEWEPALTQQRFRELLREYLAKSPDFGFAIIEEGPFQVVVASFRPEPGSSS